MMIKTGLLQEEMMIELSKGVHIPLYIPTNLPGFTSSPSSPTITTGMIKAVVVLGEASAHPPLFLVARCHPLTSSQGKEKRAGRWWGGNVESKLH